MTPQAWPRASAANSTPCSRPRRERWLRDLDLVKREEFEAVKDMARPRPRGQRGARRPASPPCEAKLGHFATASNLVGDQPDISDMRLDG